MQAPTLLPCPFCGSPPAYQGAAIRCTPCNFSMHATWSEVKGLPYEEALALGMNDTQKRWNKRAFYQNQGAAT